MEESFKPTSSNPQNVREIHDNEDVAPTKGGTSLDAYDMDRLGKPQVLRVRSADLPLCWVHCADGGGRLMSCVVEKLWVLLHLWLCHDPDEHLGGCLVVSFLLFFFSDMYVCVYLDQFTNWVRTSLFGLLNGGTAGAIYMYIITWTGFLLITLSMAEMASM